MSVEAITTHFIAHPQDVERAYELYRERIERAGVDIIAVSPRPIDLTADPALTYQLWDLRTEAAYAKLPEPEMMRLYELNALVEHDYSDDEEDWHENFFFEGAGEDTVFPGALRIGVVRLARRPRGEVHSYLVHYLGKEGNEAVAQRLFEQLADAAGTLTVPEELTVLDEDDKLGPLWVRDGALNAAGRGDGWFSLGKQGWEGWFLTDLEPEKVQALVEENLDPDAMVVARLVAEPF